MCGAGEKVFIRKWCALEMNRQREIPGREMQCRPELLIPGGRQHELDCGAAPDPACLDRDRDSPFPAISRNMDRIVEERRVGKGGACTGRYRRQTYPKKKN